MSKFNIGKPAIKSTNPRFGSIYSPSKDVSINTSTKDTKSIIRQN